MDSKSAINLVGSVFVYLLFAGLFLLLPVSALGPTGDQDVKLFQQLFQHNALTVLGVAFACSVLWFAAGEWMISAWAPARTWLLTWFALLAVTLGVAIYFSFQGPHGGSTDPVNYSVASYYLLAGPVAFYLASVLFSPTNGQYTVWPSSLVRRGW